MPFVLLIIITIVRMFLLHFSYLLLTQTPKKSLTWIVALPDFNVC